MIGSKIVADDFAKLIAPVDFELFVKIDENQKANEEFKKRLKDLQTKYKEHKEKNVNNVMHFFFTFFTL